MGTNYYVQTRKPCEHCGRPYDDERLHIGKSSAGWVFLMRIHPDRGINDLNDWAEIFAQEDAVIHDEYDNEISKFAMLRRIVCRRPGLRVDQNSAKETHTILYTTMDREFS